ncbi:MAG: DUF4093 domain-containing protein, partial [Clostridiales bacterium]|nr:DUF4093 domain-containing protein [Clostridiales bacterium]
KKSDFYAMGLVGMEDSAEKRRVLAKRLGMPPRLSANGLLETINMLYTIDEFLEKVRDCSIDPTAQPHIGESPPPQISPRP